MVYATCDTHMRISQGICPKRWVPESWARVGVRLVHRSQIIAACMRMLSAI